MKLLDTIRKQLDSVEATNASKIYTPFTLFCIFFAIYFNADILGSIFLSDKWAIKSAALKTLTDRSWDIWFGFAFRVISYSLGMMVLYGLAQAGAAFVWGVSNWINSGIAKFINSHGYIKRELYNEISNNLRNQVKDYESLYDSIKDRQSWSPSVWVEQDDTIKTLKDQVSNYLKKNNDLEADNLIQTKELSNLTEERAKELERLIILGFLSGQSDAQFTLVTKYIDEIFNIDLSDIRSSEKTNKQFESLVDVVDGQGSWQKMLGVDFGGNSSVELADLDYLMGALCTLLQLLKIIDVQVVLGKEGHLVRITHTKFGLEFMQDYREYGLNYTLNNLNEMVKDY